MKSNWSKLIMVMVATVIFATPVIVSAQDGGSIVYSTIWCKAVLKVPGDPVTLKWKQVGRDTTPSGDNVVSGYFYADPNDFAYGSSSNPEVFVKIYGASNGWTNIAFNHVTVDAVDIFSANEYNGTPDQSGTITLDRRLVENQYTVQAPEPDCNTTQFPLVISNLSFPSTVKADDYVTGSVSYQGDFQRVANPIIALQLSTGSSTITSYMHNSVTVDGCTLNFEVHIPDDASGNGTLYFKLVDYVDYEDLPPGQNNYDDNGASNEIYQSTYISR